MRAHGAHGAAAVRHSYGTVRTNRDDKELSARLLWPLTDATSAVLLPQFPFSQSWDLLGIRYMTF